MKAQNVFKFVVQVTYDMGGSSWLRVQGCCYDYCGCEPLRATTKSPNTQAQLPPPNQELHIQRVWVYDDDLGFRVYACVHVHKNTQVFCDHNRASKEVKTPKLDPKTQTLHYKLPSAGLLLTSSARLPAMML